MSFLMRHKSFVGVFLLLLSLNAIFFFVTPDDVVTYIGADNVYLVLFLISAIAGVSIVTSSVLYASIVTFAVGGATPWLLGVAAGCGLAIGDSLIFLLFRYAALTMPASTQAKIDTVAEKINHVSYPAQYLLIYLYLGFSPLPNDILMFVLATLKFSWWKIFPLILLGGITLATLLAYLGEQVPFYK